MMLKKGAATVVAWVLLLGFSIGLATTVFLWTMRQTEDISKSTVKYVEGGLQCDSIMINVDVTNPSDGCNLKITNTRYLNITKINFRKLKPEDPISYLYEEKALEPKSQDKLESRYTLSIDIPAVTGSNYCGEVEVMPIVGVNNEMVACKNKAIIVDCKPC